MAIVFNSLNDQPAFIIPVPAELAQQIEKWAETVAPDVLLNPDHRAPDCLYVVEPKSPNDT